MVLPIIIPPDAAMPARHPWTFRYVYACAGGTPLGAHTPCMRKKHLHGVIDCMVEVWISPVTFLLTLIIRSNYSISIALWRQIYALHIAGIPNADVSVTRIGMRTTGVVCLPCSSSFRSARLPWRRMHWRMLLPRY